MDPTWLVLLALAVGLVVGAGAVLIAYAAARRGRTAAEIARPSVPDGAEQVLAAMASPSMILDPSNTVVAASASAHAAGLVADNVLVHPEVVALVDTVRRTGQPRTEDLELRRGPYGTASVYLRVHVARHGSRYVLLLAEDHTEARRLESVRRDFIANISHEMKTPVGAIGLLAEALDAAADDPDQVRKFSARLGEESARLGRISRDVIELSRLQATDTIGVSELVSIDEVIDAAVDKNRVAAEAMRVTVARGKRSDASVYGDESLLVAAVHNLIANAIQHSPEKSRIGVGVRRAGRDVEITVTDQGDGIPATDLDRVFERFYRVDPARSRATGGTGLGLAIVKHAVQNHGGDVRVWSQPGRGSTFTIRLAAASPVPAVSAGGSEEETP